MRYAHILARITDTPWFITEAALGAVADLIEARVLATAIAPAARSEKVEDDDAGESLAVPQAAPIAVISARGILGKNLSLVETLCGGCDYDRLTTLIAAAAEDPDVRAVVLNLDSPGGTAVGCAEAFTRINAIRAKTGKPIYAFTDSKVCSAAYYLAAACDEIACTESATVGCIGAMLTIEDRSAQLALQGVRRLTIKSASMKDIGNPDRAPTPEEMTELQKRIDFLGGLFKRDVMLGREGAVAAEVFEKGLTYFGEQAVAVGLVDAVVPGLTEFVAMLRAQFDTSTTPTTSAT